MVEFHVHLKPKFHNLHDELVTVNVDFLGAKRIYHALQQDWEERECKAMEINVASFTSQLIPTNYNQRDE